MFDTTLFSIHYSNPEGNFFTFVKLAHISVAIFFKSMPLFCKLFASPNFHREIKKLKVGPTSRSPPTLTQNFVICIKRKLMISK
jgi:hypothetical protein